MRSQSLHEVFLLIRSMTPNEKRYFKLFATFTGKREDNNYLELFSRLNESLEYDEVALMDYIQQQAYARHFQSTVYHLFHLILRSLKVHQAGKTEEAKLRELVDGARILFEKAQYRAARKLLSRARKKAEKREDSMIMLEILEIEQTLLFKLESRKLETAIDEHLDRVRKEISSLEEKAVMAALRDKQRALRTLRTQSLSSTQKEKFDEIMVHPALQENREFSSMRAALDYHHIKGSDAMLRRDYATALEHFTINAEIWEARPEQIERSPREYIRSLTVLLSVSIWYKRFTLAEAVMTKLRKVRIASPEDEITLLNLSAYSQLVYYLNTGKFEEVPEVISAIDGLLKRHQDKVPVARKITLYYNLTILQFVMGRFREALNWLNEILNLPRSEVRQGTQDFARIFQIVVHYELGNADLVEYLFRGAYRHYQGKKKIQDFEKIVFKHLRNLVLPVAGDQKETMRQMYSELWALAMERKVKEPTGIFELIFWLESKLEGCSILETYQKRIRERLENLEQEKDPDVTFKRGEDVLKEIQKKD